MKLKTLKDLKRWCHKHSARKVKTGFRTPMIAVVNMKELKEEAIKWVKEYGFGTIGAFSEFFNITEEDLKCSGDGE